MMVAKISTEHKAEIDRLEEEFNKEISSLSRNEKELKEQLETYSVDNSDLRKKLGDATTLCSKLQEEISRSLETHEEEVQLRLQFESKLNGLHSLHRDLQARYDRAVQDIYGLEALKSVQRDKIEIQNEELLLLRSCKIENEAKVMFQDERIKALLLESDMRFKQVRELEAKLITTHSVIE